MSYRFSVSLSVILFLGAMAVAVFEPLTRAKPPACKTPAAGQVLPPLACTSDGSHCIQDGRLLDCTTGFDSVLICGPNGDRRWRQRRKPNKTKRPKRRADKVPAVVIAQIRKDPGIVPFLRTAHARGFSSKELAGLLETNASRVNADEMSWRRGLAAALLSIIENPRHDGHIVRSVLKENGVELEDLREAGLEEERLRVITDAVASDPKTHRVAWLDGQRRRLRGLSVLALDMVISDDHETAEIRQLAREERNRR